MLFPCTCVGAVRPKSGRKASTGNWWSPTAQSVGRASGWWPILVMWPRGSAWESSRQPAATRITGKAASSMRMVSRNGWRWTPSGYASSESATSAATGSAWSWPTSLDLISLFERLMPPGREEIPWPMMALTLVLMRLCDPSSELRIAEHLYERSSLGDLLGIPAGQGE